MFLIESRVVRHSGIVMSRDQVRTRTSGLPTRILSRRSRWSPFMTAMITMSAPTPTMTPAIAMTLMNDSSREPRRLRM
jgi:hypothetical protein